MSLPSALPSLSLVLLGLACATVSAPTAPDDPELDRGLAAYLPMTRDLLDHSPNAHPVVVKGEVRVFEGAALFPGGDAWLELPTLPFDREFAVSAWVNLEGRADTYGLLQQLDQPERNRHLHLMLRDGARPYLGFYENDSHAHYRVGRSTWTHLVFQYHQGDQEIWVDGHRAAWKSTGPYRGKSGVTAIGRNPRWNNLPAADFDGRMRELRIYSRALEHDDIRELHRRDRRPGA
jgi:hypothetical protein